MAGETGSRHGKIVEAGPPGKTCQRMLIREEDGLFGSSGFRDERFYTDLSELYDFKIASHDRSRPALLPLRFVIHLAGNDVSGCRRLTAQLSPVRLAVFFRRQTSVFDSHVFQRRARAPPLHACTWTNMNKILHYRCPQTQQIMHLLHQLPACKACWDSDNSFQRRKSSLPLRRRPSSGCLLSLALTSLLPFCKEGKILQV